MSVLVVAVDGSLEAQRAIDAAARLARATGAAVSLVHVGPQPETLQVAGEHDGFSRAYAGYADAMLRRLAQSPSLAGLTVTTRVLEGDPATCIAAHAREASADLVVSGSRGLNAVTRLLVGSVSTRLLHLCDRPVMIVR